MMEPKPWIQVATPHQDIRQGQLDESVFAADLSDVVANRGPLEYRDAALFFRKTYLTQGLVRLLATVLGRLSGASTGDGVIQIQTPFGGGKTHSLIALYHLVKHGREIGGDVVQEILQQVGLSAPPNAQVATFVGTAADAVNGKTPWGELAEQLGQYELLREHDRKRRAPGKDLLHKLLSQAPTLILMDEIAEYAVKAKDFHDQLVAFYQELTETVKVLPRCVLVVTLPSSDPYGEEGERALRQLQQVFKRVETICTSVEGEDTYEVIRRRLFENTGDERDIRRTAEAFFELYQRLGDDVPREVREPAYRDRMIKAYPFHPEVIDVLFERWSTFSDFQRTRGVLRLLANLVSELYRKQHAAPLILPAHWNMANPAVRGEFLRHIGNEYAGVIASDIAGNGNAKAERIDQQMGSEYTRFRVASGLAAAIFFGSFSGSERQGVGIQRLRLALVQPGLPPAMIADALRRLEEELWYLHVEGGFYHFSSQPNLNRVIIEKEEAVRSEQVDEEMRNRLEKLAGREFEVILWPKVPQDVPDTRELKLVVLDPDRVYAASETETFVREILEKYGQTFRVYRNTLVVLAADAGDLAGLRMQIKRLLAYRAVQNDKALLGRLSEDNKRTLKDKLEELEGGIAHSVMSGYRHLAKAGGNGVQWFDMGLPTVGGVQSLASRVQRYLQGEDLLLSKISPQRILQKALREDELEKPVDEIYETFLKFVEQPMLESKQVVLDAIARGVQERLFGVRVGGRVFFGEGKGVGLEGKGVGLEGKGVGLEPISPLQLEEDAVLVREVSTPDQPVVEQPPMAYQTPASNSPQLVRNGTTGATLSASVANPTVRTCKIKAQISWDKLSDFLRGVIMPLNGDGADVQIEVTLEAHSEHGIKRSTLDQKVYETLQQIGATIIDRKEE